MFEIIRRSFFRVTDGLFKAATPGQQSLYHYGIAEIHYLPSEVVEEYLFQCIKNKVQTDE